MTAQIDPSQGDRPSDSPEESLPVKQNRGCRFLRAGAPDRGALIDGGTVPTPWRGACAAYRLHDALTYWQGHIGTWERSLHD